MKLFKTLAIVFFIISASIFAQDKNLVKPFPKCGLNALMSNVVYPESAKKANLEGGVIVKALINKTGNVVSAEVVKSLSNECDRAAVEGVRKTEFSPGVTNGKKLNRKLLFPLPSV